MPEASPPPSTSKSPNARRRITAQTMLLMDPSQRRPKAVASSFPRSDWQARQPAKIGQLPHPGTALRIDEVWYEIVELRSEKNRWTYVLAPWDDSFVMRATDEPTPTACAEAFHLYQREIERLERGRGLRKIPFLTGLLPSDMQHRLEVEYGVPAMRATAISAMVYLVISGFLLMAGFAASQGIDFGPWTGFFSKAFRWFPLLALIFVESLVRWRLGMTLEDPVGSFLVSAPITVYRTFRDELRAIKKPPPPAASAKAPHAFSQISDTVRPWPHPDAELEILSRLPKEHWTVNRTGLVIDGECYQLVAREVLESGEERHRFLLQKPEYEVLYQSLYEYDPKEVREVYREKRRRETATWIETMNPLWGLLDQERQERLGRLYSYDPERGTLWMILGGALFTTVNLIIFFFRLISGAANLFDFLLCLFCVLLARDTILRWNAWQKERLRESFLSSFLRGFADRALKWEPSLPSPIGVLPALGEGELSEGDD